MESDKSDDYLMISGIQHFLFCRRQWALIHIEQQWCENVLTVEGKILHDRAHDEKIVETRNNILSVRGMRIKSDLLKITGCCDVVEFIPSSDGIQLRDKIGNWLVRPVEYKRGSPKVNDCDRMQATAQAVCLEEMFSCKIEEAVLYYEDTKHREVISITDEMRTLLKKTVSEMYGYYLKGYTPVVKPTKKCDNCSLKENCLPKMLKINEKRSVQKYIISAVSKTEKEEA